VFTSITKKSFWFNLLIAALLGFAVLFVFFQMLDWITQHGKYIKVPEVKGKTIEDAKKILEAQGFEVEVLDSVYFDTLPKLSVVNQAPMLPMPNFVGQTFRSVEMQIKTLGLKLGDTTYKPDFAVGSILEQYVNGAAIKAGIPVPMGSRIDLVIGGGVQQNDIPVPYLLGLTFAEAKVILETNGLLLGAIVTDGPINDSLQAFVIKQSPPKRDEEGRPVRIRGGQLMDLWISMDRTKIDSSGNEKPAPVKTDNEY
jgi:eukaryotic-like serine/threonine-protein kinase